MASNDGSVSTKPSNKNAKKKKAAPRRDSAVEVEPQLLTAPLAPTGKRRRLSDAIETRRDFMGQPDSSHNNEAGTNAVAGADAAAQSAYRGNGTSIWHYSRKALFSNIYF